MSDEQSSNATKGSQRKSLGRGLAALIGEIENPANDTGKSVSAAQPTTSVAPDRQIPIEMIKTGDGNPRRQFPKDELDELSQSIAKHGIVQPILVRPLGRDEYQLIAGERRWRAAQQAGLHKIPAIVREVDDREALELALIENIQRADLNPVDEAMGYKKLMNEHEYRQEDLGKALGKSRSHVANMLRLLNLPQKVLDLLADGQLSSGHARALVPLSDPQFLAQKIIKEGLSVRGAERCAALLQKGESLTTRKVIHRSADEKALERRLSEAVGLKISLSHKDSGRGKLVIHYKTLDQLNDFVDRIS